jgi:hypothetical protein
MKFSLVAFLSLPALAAAAGTTIHEKIIDEKRHIVFNSRRLSDECCTYDFVCLQAFD